MKKMKRIAALGLAVMMMASALTGCSSSNETETATTENGPVKIEFWHSMGSTTGELVQEIVDEFNASQEDVVVECIYQGDYTSAGTKLQAAISGGNAPHPIPIMSVSDETA